MILPILTSSGFMLMRNEIGDPSVDIPEMCSQFSEM